MHALTFNLGTPYMTRSDDLKALSHEVEAALALGRGEIIQGAYEAIDSFGYEPGSISGNPLAVWDKFYAEKLGPFLEKSRAQFSELVLSTIATFSSEGFSGPATAKALIGVGAADALQKMLPNAFAGEFDFGALTNTDWAMLAFALMVSWDFLSRGEEGAAE